MLAANSIYYIVSQETTGGDAWYGNKLGGHPILMTTGVAAINSAIYLKGFSWTVEGSTGESFIPVNFKYN